MRTLDRVAGARPTADAVFAAVGAAGLLVPGVLAFQPTFGDVSGVIAAAAGVLVGCAVVAVGARLGWPWWRHLVALAVSYFVLGGAVALPQTTLGGFIPTPDTWYRLAVLVVQGWRDLLTVNVPAGDFVGPAVVPWFAGLVVGAATAALALRSRGGEYRALWPLLPAVGWLSLAIAFGGRDAPYALWLGLLLGVLAVGWIVVCRQRAEGVANRVLVGAPKDRQGSLLRAIAAVGVLAVAATGALGVSALAAAPAERAVIRDHVAPPLRLEDYASPLMWYRSYETTMKDSTLWTVTGFPRGGRLRLATMDTFDGNVYNVSQDSSNYVRIGRLTGAKAGELAATELGLAVGDYAGVWTPSPGFPLSLTTPSGQAADTSEGLYLNRGAGTVLTTSSWRKGDAFTLTAAVSPTLSEQERASLKGRPVGRTSAPVPQNVPQQIGEYVDKAIGQAASPYEQLTAIAEKLRADGFYSDGSDGRSRSGHTSERIGAMLAAPSPIGDDEQYAVAMALMGSRLGIPMRVVLGFYPETAGDPAQPWAVKGTEAHVWVEAAIEGAGWVSFDPTPDRDKKPKTQVPRPIPKPKPQVEPPPDPPQLPPKEPITQEPDAVKNESSSGIGQIVLISLAVLGILVALAAPFALIVGVKAARASRRRTAADDADRLVGGWDEVVDRARDLGARVPGRATRPEAAGGLDQEFPEARISALAVAVDAGVFGPERLVGPTADAAWVKADASLTALAAGLPWYRRAFAALSLRSFLTRSRVAGGGAAAQISPHGSGG